MRFQRELLMVRLRLMADFNWRARVAKGPVGCKLEGRDELPVLAARDVLRARTASKTESRVEPRELGSCRAGSARRPLQPDAQPPRLLP
jgi:hypothetical protein